MLPGLSRRMATSTAGQEPAIFTHLLGISASKLALKCSGFTANNQAGNFLAGFIVQLILQCAGIII